MNNMCVAEQVEIPLSNLFPQYTTSGPRRAAVKMASNSSHDCTVAKLKLVLDESEYRHNKSIYRSRWTQQRNTRVLRTAPICICVS